MKAPQVPFLKSDTNLKAAKLITLLSLFPQDIYKYGVDCKTGGRRAAYRPHATSTVRFCIYVRRPFSPPFDFNQATMPSLSLVRTAPLPIQRGNIAAALLLPPASSYPAAALSAATPVPLLSPLPPPCHSSLHRHPRARPRARHCLYSSP